MIHAPERVKAIRERAAIGLKSVAVLDKQIKDPGFRERLQLIQHMLEDIESFFLGSLSRESRTPEQEAYWLRQAEMWESVFIAPQLKVVQDALEKYGPTVTMI